MSLHPLRIAALLLPLLATGCSEWLTSSPKTPEQGALTFAEQFMNTLAEGDTRTLLTMVEFPFMRFGRKITTAAEFQQMIQQDFTLPGNPEEVSMDWQTISFHPATALSTLKPDGWQFVVDQGWDRNTAIVIGTIKLHADDLVQPLTPKQQHQFKVGKPSWQGDSEEYSWLDSGFLLLKTTTDGNWKAIGIF